MNTCLDASKIKINPLNAFRLYLGNLKTLPVDLFTHLSLGLPLFGMARESMVFPFCSVSSTGLSI